MENILKELGFDPLIPKFSAERIQPENVSTLSDEQLSRLGVTTIGDRIRLRGLCAAAEKDRQSVAADVLHERMARFSGRNNRRGDRKRKALARRSWTVSFVCVADRHQSRIPSATEKQVLFHAGLGLKKIKLDLEDDENSVLEKITCGEKDDHGEIKGFPQLKDCGGFEILYCVSGCKELKPLNCCWTAKDLKANVGAQSKLFLRPIQRNLSTVSVLPQNRSQVKEKCNICNKDVLMRDLRYHVFMCKSREGLLSSDSDDDSLNHSVFSQRSMSVQEGYRQDQNASSSSVQEGQHRDQNASSSSVQEGQHQDHNTSGSPSLSGDPIAVAEVVDLVDNNDQQPGGVDGEVLSVDDTVAKVAAYCTAQNINNPVEILRCLQRELVIGRPLEVTDVTQCTEGLTNFILVDRDKLLSTAFDELKSYHEYRVTLEVQFYDEAALDYGGPRKEFFRLALSEIKKKYFDQGIREHLFEDYFMVGLIMGLSVVQNGKIPTFLEEETIIEIFQKTEAMLSPALANLRRGLKETGVYQICEAMPMFLHLFRPSDASVLSLKMVTTLLKPNFSESGSNRRRFENEVYAAFTKYLREAASGRRGDVCLSHVLQFATGSDEEPMLGFELHPSLIFTEVIASFIPTANTCSNTLYLPHATRSKPLPETEALFDLYDYAFVNVYFGNK